jgi:hypothetical protein
VRGIGRPDTEASLRRVGLIATILFALSLVGGCIIHTRTGSSRQHSKRCKPGKVLVKHKGKWKCKKPKKAKKHKRDHRKHRDHRD